ncbi:hypothetical protein NQ318_011177 [Aromia moschata]|uniref:Glycosyltransferase-like protein LARGE2 n=1 Tax=Aromia moschata TaxID=1265417 RepID=A0AAV8YHD1_9CUCU|nr:hypothetical protein NQ318_011177 [Aromia moschata]
MDNNIINCHSNNFLIFKCYPSILHTSKPLYSKKSDDLKKQSFHIFSKEDIFKNYYPSSQPKIEDCEVIHIGVVCSGYNANLYFHTLLKSIYFYRVNPIHFHVIANRISENILKTLFDTWNVPQVNITFYDLNELTSEVRWVPNSHYSGVHGLMKLIFPRIIPLNVTTKLIVLDTDLIVVNDIYQLWKLFEVFNQKQAIGIVENQSDYYLGKLTSYSPWPAIGRGFNSGVLLYNLQVLKRVNWPKLWSNVAKKKALVYGTTNSSEEFCWEFHKLLSSSWRTLLYFKEYKYSVLQNDVALVAQLSYDRLQTIEELAKYWPGPISLTLYVSDPELTKSISFISDSEILQDRTNIAYHAVFKDGDYYPINALRNVGLRSVQTPYVFLTDIDFLPNKHMYDMALIVPAFEIQKYGSLIPRNKKQLLKGLRNKSVVPFLSSIWSSGHAPTNYEKWKTAEEPYQVKWEPDYEPYVIVRSDVVEYDERFVGFGWNKVSHIMELEAQNYEFIVLPDVFIVHKPHAPSYDIGRYRSSATYRLCLQVLKEEVIQKLNKKYNRLFEYSNSSINFANIVNKRRKRNFVPPEQTTVEINTDYPFNTE